MAVMSVVGSPLSQARIENAVQRGIDNDMDFLVRDVQQGAELAARQYLSAQGWAARTTVLDRTDPLTRDALAQEADRTIVLGPVHDYDIPWIVWIRDRDAVAVTYMIYEGRISVRCMSPSPSIHRAMD